MREFSSGATRDTVEGKLSYMKALSPAVLRRYLQYLSKHRIQADGKLRDFDNWKKGIDRAVYLDSLLRHTMDAWLVTEGIEPTEDGAVLENLLCAIMFNTMGYLHEVLRAKQEKKQ